MDKMFDIKKIKLIIGLGNIGKNYIQTRHNAGFLFTDSFIQELNLNAFTKDTKFKADISVNSLESFKLILAKPTTLMNRSGESVTLIADYFKIETENILVVHDDLDIQLGNYKIQLGKGPKVHNGIISIEEHLNSDQFWRLRIGIDNRTLEEKANIPGQSYVLSNFPLAERDILNSIIQKAISDIKLQLFSDSKVLE